MFGDTDPNDNFEGDAEARIPLFILMPLVEEQMMPGLEWASGGVSSWRTVCRDAAGSKTKGGAGLTQKLAMSPKSPSKCCSSCASWSSSSSAERFHGKAL